jgi:hypothetical protein
VLLASSQALVDLRIRAIRDGSSGTISELPRIHPLRQRFGRLHGISMLLLALQMLLAAGVVAARAKEPAPLVPRPVASDAPSLEGDGDGGPHEQPPLPPESAAP